jgi:hypothetical protein
VRLSSDAAYNDLTVGVLERLTKDMLPLMKQVRMLFRSCKSFLLSSFYIVERWDGQGYGGFFHLVFVRM